MPIKAIYLGNLNQKGIGTSKDYVDAMAHVATKNQMTLLTQVRCHQ